MGSPSLAWELFRTTATFAGGMAAFHLGRLTSNRSALSRNAALIAGTITALLFASMNSDLMRRWIGASVSEWVSGIGGPGTGAALSSLIVIGAAWNRNLSPRRIIPSLGLAIAFVLLILLNSGSLAWRGFGASLRMNYPNSQGILSQTTPITCAPAAAAMMLWDAGIRVSEGELAERANSNPIIGTDLYALSRAANDLCRVRHLKCFADLTDYEHALVSDRSFVAFVNLPGIGGHALYVKTISPDSVTIRDPLTGSEDRLPRSVFEKEWKGARIWLEPDDSAR